MKKAWKILEHTTPYDGYFKMEKYRVSHTHFQGGWGAPITREVFERGHAAAVLPYDPELDQVALVEQFRIGALEAKGGPWLTEVIAGIIEPGENAEDVIQREAMEEANLQLLEVLPIVEYLVSPGGATERISLFCARADLSKAGGIHGLGEEGEDIRVHGVSSDQALEWLHTGKINNAMTIIALQWFEINRQSLPQRFSQK